MIHINIHTTARQYHRARACIALVGVITLATAVGPAVRQGVAQERETDAAARSTPTTTTTGRSVTVAATRYPYAVQVPTGTMPPPGWPVILALHGAGSRGDDGMRMRGQSIAEAARTFPDRYPAIVVMPQTTGRWTAAAQDAALAALAEVEGLLATDRARTYLVGQSMGADGALELAAHHPERFAALVLVAPGCCGVRVEPEALSALPVRIFHGDADRIPISYSRDLVTRLRAAGNDDARLIEYAEAGHDIFDRAYAEPTLAAWLLRQVKPGDTE